MDKPRSYVSVPIEEVIGGAETLLKSLTKTRERIAESSATRLDKARKEAAEAHNAFWLWRLIGWTKTEADYPRCIDCARRGFSACIACTDAAFTDMKVKDDLRATQAMVTACRSALDAGADWVQLTLADAARILPKRTL